MTQTLVGFGQDLVGPAGLALESALIVFLHFHLDGDLFKTVLVWMSFLGF